MGKRTEIRHRRDNNIGNIRVGAWWRLSETAHGGDPKRDRGPRQIGQIDRSDPLLPRVIWANKQIRGRQSSSVENLLKNYEPCAAPVAAPEQAAPKTNGAHVPSKGAGDYLRDIVREEIALGLAAFLAELRPALRTEAEKAVRAAFGEATQ